jgi:hypothetical protein
VIGVRLTNCASHAGDLLTGEATLKRAVMRAGAQMNDFLSSEERPSVCKRGLDGKPSGYAM